MVIEKILVTVSLCLIQRIKLGRKIAKSHKMWRALKKAAGTHVTEKNPLNNQRGPIHAACLSVFSKYKEMYGNIEES